MLTTTILPKRALSNIELKKYVKLYSIKYFRNVFMQDALPFKISRQNECGIINLDRNDGPGTHWVAYRKTKNVIKYFDPAGNLAPPPKIVEYFHSRGPVNISYNYNQRQYKTYNCGHLCLEFLLT